MATAAIRNDLVHSAVKFLQHPTLQSTSLEKRLAFLVSKGLTKEEINEALRLIIDRNALITQIESATSEGQNVDQAVHQLLNTRQKVDWRDNLFNAAIMGGLAYAILSTTMVIQHV
jgi:peroxin-14